MTSLGKGIYMSNLFTFLENFDVNTPVEIYENGAAIFSGVVGDVPQRISNMTSVVRGTTKFVNGCMIIDVKKC